MVPGANETRQQVGPTQAITVGPIRLDIPMVVLPGGTPHFHWAKSGEYVTQVTATGPITLDYVDPEDDPRNK